MTKRYNLDQIREHFSIIHIAEEYDVDLEYSNGGYIALCPFHDDLSTKSFRIYPHNESWFCFGCQRGGTVFDFVMLAEDVSFARAAEILAQRSGIEASTALPDLNLNKSFPLAEFKEMREIIEERITLTMRQRYFYAKKFPDPEQRGVLLLQIFELWKWIDKGCRYFDGKLLEYKKKIKQRQYVNEYEFFGFLNNKLQSFYSKFVEKSEGA